MESRFDFNPEQEGEAGWKSSLPPQSSTGTGAKESQETQVPLRNTGNLCARVSEMLPSLIEGDGEIRPEMATAIYGHLAVCPDCAKEYDRQQRTVMLLEQLPLLDLPKDFSGLVMDRIQAEMGSYKDGVLKRQQANHAETLSRLSQSNETAVVSTQSAALYSHLSLHQRAVLTGLFAALLLFFLASEWGRTALGGNAEAIISWLRGAGDASHSLPVLGQTVQTALSGLSQMAETIRESFVTLGATAAQGLAIDAALGAGAFLLYSRRGRQTQQIH